MQNQTDTGRQLALRPPPPLDGEIIAPGDGSIQVVARRHPLKTDTTLTRVAAGQTIDQIVQAVVPDARWRRFACCYVGDRLMPRDLWHAMRPKPGTRVTIAMVPQGGGGSSDILHIVLFIAIAAAALILPGLQPLAFPILGGLLTAGQAIALGVSIVGAPCRFMLISREPPT